MVLSQILTLAAASAIFTTRSIVEKSPLAGEAIVHRGVRYEGTNRRLRAWDERTKQLLWEHEAPGDAGEIVALHAQDGWLVGASESGRTFSIEI